MTGWLRGDKWLFRLGPVQGTLQRVDAYRLDWRRQYRPERRPTVTAWVHAGAPLGAVLDAVAAALDG